LAVLLSLLSYLYPENRNEPRRGYTGPRLFTRDTASAAAGAVSNSAAHAHTAVSPVWGRLSDDLYAALSVGVRVVRANRAAEVVADIALTTGPPPRVWGIPM